MKIAELRELLAGYPDDYEVMIAVETEPDDDVYPGCRVYDGYSLKAAADDNIPGSLVTLMTGECVMSPCLAIKELKRWPTTGEC